jgi:protocatechuate 3,4-dioxygenase beta subunit
MQPIDKFDLGLTADVSMLLRAPVARRRLLGMGAAGIGMLLAGCSTSGGPPGAPPQGNSSPTAVAANGACVSVPGETNGPYPSDGSNGKNILTASGIVRSDIRASLGTGKVATGVPTTIEFTLINVSNNCAPLAGYALYAWHCDSAGLYSMYSDGATGEDYLRGVQAADANGKVTFQTIFPACYAGRWPHVHFEVYPSLAKATGTANVVHTSQLAVPEEACKAVFNAVPEYSASIKNLSQITLATDNVFGDGYTSELATISGDVASGYIMKLNIGVAV